MQQLALIGDDSSFPPSHLAFDDPEGLIAVSQGLSARLIWRAYHYGYYPCSPVDESLQLWWTPAQRMVLYPDQLHLSTNFKKRVKRIAHDEYRLDSEYKITTNVCFERVIRLCASAPRNAAYDGAWISDEVIAAYSELHQHRVAHSFEVWRSGHLIGGLYGVKLGKIFCGESMFSLESQASRLGFAYAVPFLQHLGIALIDCQQASDYLASQGAVLISRQDYEAYLSRYTTGQIELGWPAGRLAHDGNYLYA